MSIIIQPCDEAKQSSAVIEVYIFLGPELQQVLEPVPTTERKYQIGESEHNRTSEV